MRRVLHRTTALAAVGALASTLAGAAPAQAAKAKPVTFAQLQSASVPALCGHPAGRLVKGRLPGIAAGAGKVVLAGTPLHHGGNTLAVGDLTGDGVPDAAAVVLCSTGSTARPSSIQLYTSGGKRIGGFDLATYTHRPTDIVAKLVIAHRRVAVEWTANQKGDAPCCPSLDYAVDLSLKGKAVVPSHARTYTDGLAADLLSGAVRSGNRKAALALATPHVVAQMFAVQKAGYLAAVFEGLGAPARDPRWGSLAYRVGVRGATAPAWLNTDKRYAVGQFGLSSHVSVIRLQHLGWRKWRADYFLQTTSG